MAPGGKSRGRGRGGYTASGGGMGTHWVAKGMGTHWVEKGKPGELGKPGEWDNYFQTNAKATNIGGFFAAAQAMELAQGHEPSSANPVGANMFLGKWVDSLGNTVVVYNTDAYQTALIATLSKPPRPDIHLAVHADANGIWICGNAVLDYMWSTPQQLHWLSKGRVSVWVRQTDTADNSLAGDAATRQSSATVAKAPDEGGAVEKVAQI